MTCLKEALVVFTKIFIKIYIFVFHKRKVLNTIRLEYMMSECSFFGSAIPLTQAMVDYYNKIHCFCNISFLLN